MPELFAALVPVFGAAISAAVRWWGSRGDSAILIPEEARERLGSAPEVTLSPELVRQLEEGERHELVAEVEERPAAAPELTTAKEAASGSGSWWTRENLTFGAVFFFSAAGFIWSVIILSIDSSTDAKYGATATLGWIFGYWFQPDLLRRRRSRDGDD